MTACDRRGCALLAGTHGNGAEKRSWTMYGRERRIATPDGFVGGSQVQHTSTLAESRRRRAAIVAGNCDCVIRVPVRRIPVASQVNVRHTTCGNRRSRSFQRRLSKQTEYCYLRICPVTSPYPSLADGPRHPRLPVDRTTSPSFACLRSVVAITNTVTITTTYQLPSTWRRNKAPRPRSYPWWARSRCA